MATNASVFYGQDIGFLRRHKAELEGALSAIALGKTVTIAGRQIGREDYDVIASALSAVNFEIKRQESIAADGTEPLSSSRVFYPDFTAYTS